MTQCPRSALVLLIALDHLILSPVSRPICGPPFNPTPTTTASYHIMFRPLCVRIPLLVCRGRAPGINRFSYEVYEGVQKNIDTKQAIIHHITTSRWTGGRSHSVGSIPHQATSDIPHTVVKKRGAMSPVSQPGKQRKKKTREQQSRIPATRSHVAKSDRSTLAPRLNNTHIGPQASDGSSVASIDGFVPPRSLEYTIKSIIDLSMRRQVRRNLPWPDHRTTFEFASRSEYSA